MTVIARRFTILTLMMMIFALVFSALAAQPGRRSLHLQSGLATECDVLSPCTAML